MEISVDVGCDTPPSRQIVEAILDAIAAGTIGAGAKLLSVRALAAEALVNPNTAARAYRDLETLGVVAARNGLGVFVTDEGPGIARDARGQRTLEAFRRAAAEALRAGHAPATLRDIIQANGVKA